jgi:hypothetical protein
MRAALAALLFVGCNQDITLSEVEAELVVPTPLVDVATRVGEPVPFEVRLQHFRGEPAEILSVEVVNVQGSAFAYTGDDVGAVLESNEDVFLPFEYAPTEAGFDAAALFVTTNARDGVFEITARGRASIPELSVFPAAADFGPVAADATSSVQIRLDNPGTDPITVSGTTTDGRFAVVGGAVVVEPGAFSTLPVTYTPVDAQPVTAELSLRVGTQVVATVGLRANACAAGNPALYDVDQDGTTGCSGDCDDTDAAIGPGAAELDNGIDDDCDGAIDEGTPSADDDGDGYCEATACTDGSMPGDCNDADPLMNPAGTEQNSNGLDDDCDGTVDLGAEDADGDGVAVPVDCDDTDPATRPGAVETPNGEDDDCDGAVDEGTGAADDDGDGFCESACTDGSTPGDCDDTAADVRPNATELPNFVDDDCDGTIDEGTVNEDADDDGFTIAGGDCDDGDAAVNPALGGCP